ncbi:hypothetical protein [Actinoplanes sp. NPDC048796]|uniref:hypothetical protein n=1 Tax=unclassified Actinoplanes TaxID=2626549 RepID=UPI0033C29740
MVARVCRHRVYPADLTGEQWEIIEPMLSLIKEPGRIPKHPCRAVMDAISYSDWSGCFRRKLDLGEQGGCGGEAGV